MAIPSLKLPSTTQVTFSCGFLHVAGKSIRVRVLAAPIFFPLETCLIGKSSLTLGSYLTWFIVCKLLLGT